jgi:hypothetical protein
MSYLIVITTIALTLVGVSIRQAQNYSGDRPAVRYAARRACPYCLTTSNFDMPESKISMPTMHVYNKIALPLCASDAIL